MDWDHLFSTPTQRDRILSEEPDDVPYACPEYCHHTNCIELERDPQALTNRASLIRFASPRPSGPKIGARSDLGDHSANSFEVPVGDAADVLSLQEPA